MPRPKPDQYLVEIDDDADQPEEREKTPPPAGAFAQVRLWNPARRRSRAAIYLTRAAAGPGDKRPPVGPRGRIQKQVAEALAARGLSIDDYDENDFFHLDIELGNRDVDDCENGLPGRRGRDVDPGPRGPS